MMARTSIPIVTDTSAMGPALAALKAVSERAREGDDEAGHTLEAVAALYNADKAVLIEHADRSNGHKLIAITFKPSDELLRLLGIETATKGA